jgi:hypothetical protein
MDSAGCRCLKSRAKASAGVSRSSASVQLVLAALLIGAWGWRSARRGALEKPDVMAQRSGPWLKRKRLRSWIVGDVGMSGLWAQDGAVDRIVC